MVLLLCVSTARHGLYIYNDNQCNERTGGPDTHSYLIPLNGVGIHRAVLQGPARGPLWGAFLSTPLERNAQKRHLGRPFGDTFVDTSRVKCSKTTPRETVRMHFCRHLSNEMVKNDSSGGPWEALLRTGIEPNALKDASAKPLEAKIHTRSPQEVHKGGIHRDVFHCPA